MKIFDSLKNKKWTGRGIELRGNSILVLKSAKFEHPMSIRAGEYSLEILGKKRTGSGKVVVEVLSDKEEVFAREEINLTGSAWSKYTVDFDIGRNVGLGKVRFSRDRGAYGSLELGRICVDLVGDVQVQTKISTREGRRFGRSLNISSKKINRELFSLKENMGVNDANIAFIIPYHIYGGAEVYLKGIINHLSECAVSILYMKNNALQNNITKKDVTHRVVKSFQQLRGILKSGNYDYIVYYNRADVYTLLSDMKEKKEFGAKLIEIYHSDFVWSGSLSQLKERKHVDRLISVAPSLALDIEGIGEEERVVIPVGINLETFSPKESSSLKGRLGIDANKPVIGTVARLSKEKQIGYILNLAFEMSDFEFVIVGDGPAKASLLRRKSELGLSNVRFVGYRKHVDQFYDIFDAFVLASKIEGTPISILESMASGVPVFSNMVGAIPDLIEELKTGFRLVEDPVLDAEMIRNNIYNLEVMQNARIYVEENHDERDLNDKFLHSLISLNKFFIKRYDHSTLLLKGEYI